MAVGPLDDGPPDGDPRFGRTCLTGRHEEVPAGVQGVHQLIALIFGEANISDIGFTISDTFFPIGLVFSALIDFVAVALILFVIIKAYNRFKGPEADVDTGPTEIELLAQIRDELRANKSA